MPLDWKSVLKKVTSLSFTSSLGDLLAAPDLYRVCVISVFLELNLSNLAPIKLYDSAWHKSSPLVPNLSHAHLVTKSADSLTFSNDWLGMLYFKLRVDLIVDLSVGVDLLFLGHF